MLPRGRWIALIGQQAIVFGLLVSVAVHVVVAAVLSRLPTEIDLDVASTVLVEFEGTFGPGAASAQNVLGESARSRLLLGGQRSAQNIDSLTRGASGGDGQSSDQIILMLPHADTITLQDSPMNAMGVAQTQRIHTDNLRVSEDDRRSTPNPEDAPFLASGPGDHRERRTVSNIDPAVGAAWAPTAASLGHEGSRAISEPYDDATNALGMVAVSPTRGPQSIAERTIAGGEASPGRGIVGGEGRRASSSARVATGRPPVDQARPATTTTVQTDRVEDNRNAELLAASMLQSMVESTVRAAPTRGVGLGGTNASGNPGTGTAGREGGRAEVYGPGRGAFPALDTSSERYRGWFLEQRRKIGERLNFPLQRQFAMDQGTSVFRVIVKRDGTLAGAPRLLRSSGFDDLDAAALAAIRRSTPFSPLPEDLAPGLAQIGLTMPIEFSNPMVR